MDLVCRPGVWRGDAPKACRGRIHLCPSTREVWTESPDLILTWKSAALGGGVRLRAGKCIRSPPLLQSVNSKSLTFFPGFNVTESGLFFTSLYREGILT